ncbi:import inner membrane translocase subunit TIM50 [Capsaspora owczarzaki ATCC 30864]|uniref:Mitochondrial import inner membrane translocase subunit TIM50 n=1 Tax=Capsaspora owczarzaki (strain ATCC 30864) TaxID=595528 RepID=A0A0D2WW67_CAPO3|nr:import inner membrane translocase subunit TIM50 [Capsaspora owczarzaki ATCC 30864]KJE97180.1 import inner membrane translocase subunit TIM50 [Capsaspora owczarzaki ATCC 30864]|eukprot:XP_004343502.2 import inner membrane translocase subunit TIM50 [Capsaspora owczarzaki ATCC 30864]
MSTAAFGSGRVLTGARVVALAGGTLLTALGSWMMGGVEGHHDLFQALYPEDARLRQAEITKNVYADDWVPIAYLKRSADRFRAFFETFNESQEEKLLPDPLPVPYNRPYTLVLDLDDTLVHSSWNRVSGWKTVKRPGIDLLFAHLAPWYEIIVFSSAYPPYANPILDKLDPQGYILYRLYKDSTRYSGGKHIKDLSKLNRDLARVILIDDEAEAFSMQPHNGIKIKPFQGEANDRALFELLPFLELIATNNVADVRTVIKAYEGKDLIATFRENQKRIIDENRRRQQAAQERAGRLPGLGYLGRSAESAKPAAEAPQQSTTAPAVEPASEAAPQPWFWQRWFGSAPSSA